MKILYVLNSGNPGGLEQYTLDLVKGLFSKGHIIYVWCKDGPIVDWYKNAGAQVTVKNIGFELDLVYISALSQFIKKNNIDIIHTSELKAGLNGLFGALLAGNCGIITHIHTPMSEWPVKGLVKKLYTKVENFVYSILVSNFANYEIALTQSRKDIKLKEGIKASKLFIIPNGFDFSRLDMPVTLQQQNKAQLLVQYNLPANAVIIGNVSRITEEKGHSYLVKAFAELLADTSINTSNLYLFFAGGGHLESAIKSIAQNLGIADRIRISGVFPNDDWSKYYSIFDIYAHSTIAEGFGYVLIEGMSLGIPVLCSNIPVLQEVGGDTVTYFNVADPHDIYLKLKETLTSNKNIGIRIDTSAKNRARDNFAIDIFINSYEDLYKKVMETNQ